MLLLRGSNPLRALLSLHSTSGRNHANFDLHISNCRQRSCSTEPSRTLSQAQNRLWDGLGLQKLVASSFRARHRALPGGLKARPEASTAESKAEPGPPFCMTAARGNLPLTTDIVVTCEALRVHAACLSPLPLTPSPTINLFLVGPTCRGSASNAAGPIID